MPVKFPLPNAQDPFSLKPGSISVHVPDNKPSTMDKSSTLHAAIAGARAAATQFNKKNQDFQGNDIQSGKRYSLGSQSKNKSLDDDGSNEGTSTSVENEQNNLVEHVESSSHNQPCGHLKQDLGAPSRVCSFQFIYLFKIFD